MAPVYPSSRLPDLELTLNSALKEARPTVNGRVTAEMQAAHHPMAPVDPKVFGSAYMDPSFITMQLNYAMLGGLFNSRNDDDKSAAPTGDAGSVHASENITMHRAVRLGETITFRIMGSPEQRPHRLGILTEILFEGRDASGQLVWEVLREGITVVASAIPSDAAPTKLKAAPTDARVGRVFVCSKTFTPELVVGYCNDFDGKNPIHHDPDVAVAAGFRAPIWAGAQGIHICLEHLCRLSGGPPDRLKASIKLRRAVCWDETVELWFGQTEGHRPAVGSYRLLLPAHGHKPAIEMEVHDYTAANSACL